MLEKLRATLEQHNQQHLIEEASSWTEQQQAELLEQVESVPWEDLLSVTNDKDPSSIEPSRVISKQQQAEREFELTQEGERAYVLDNVAVLMVAGGQGTRLGFPGPKGCFEIGPLSKKSVYQIHSEKIVSLSRRLGKDVPFLIMTSPATDAETRGFFQENGLFGLKESQVKFFSQGTVPSLSEDGKLLLSEPGKLLSNPDGHGGCFTALCNSGLLESLKKDGIEHLIYLQVDNILAPVYDPIFLGLARAEKADVITKVVEKTKPEEKVGLLVSADGRDGIVEYISMSEQQLNEKDESGKLKYRWGNTAMHYWRVDFLLATHDKGLELPLHRSKKPLDVYSNGKVSKQEGYKHERFIFDLLPLAEVSLGLEVRRESEFAPLKNATGVDSVETVHELTSAYFREWLLKAGAEVEEGTMLEVSPLYALDEAEFVAKYHGGQASGDTLIDSDRDTIID